MIFSSSRELAKLLVEELNGAGGQKTATTSGRAADAVIFNGDAAQAILGQNRDLIVANTMMEKGVGKPEAEGQINLLLDLLKKLRGLKVESRLDGDALKVKLELKTRLGSPSPGEGGKEKAKKEVSL